MKIYNSIELYVENMYVCQNIKSKLKVYKEYIKNRKYKNMCKV